MAGRSFIWAATAALIVADPKYRDPVTQLKHILSTPSLMNLDDLHSSALERAFPRDIDQPILSLLRVTLGMLVIARAPPTVDMLASLVASAMNSPQNTTKSIRTCVLRFLGSVLDVPDDDTTSNGRPVQFLHKSFVDFLVSGDRCHERFLVNIREQHEKMAIGCLRLMNGLERNICQLTDPSKLNSQVDDLAERIHQRIPHALRYSCEYWANHLCEVSVDNAIRTEAGSLLDVFVKEKLLFWVEVMGLLGKAKEAVSLVRLAETWIMARGSDCSMRMVHTGVDVSASMEAQLETKAPNYQMGPLTAPSPLPDTAERFKSIDVMSMLLHDIRRFIMEFMEPIMASSLHIYRSAVALIPSETALWNQYGHMAQSGLRVIRGQAEQWSQTLWTASKHSKEVTCTAISSDSTTIVSGSRDHTLHLWDAKTGAAIGQAMQGHTDSVTCVAVSPDSTTIVSGSRDHTLHLWDAKTGAAIGQAMQGHTYSVTCVAVSPDSTTIISGSTDCTLHLWDAKTGAAIGQAMQSHTNLVSQIAFLDHSQNNVFSEPSQELFGCNYAGQTQFPVMEVHKPTHAIEVFQGLITLGGAGWVCNPVGRLRFWLPANLRHGLGGRGNIVTVENQLVPIFHMPDLVS
ncbi:hypothetical protein FRB95_008407 [Tulasnella sp. JGI-2019a]|nr:hypothetical protein FRB95_008407 [Tulasnella sp. JGI-2019a]